jgi:hypothetical protein
LGKFYGNQFKDRFGSSSSTSSSSVPKLSDFHETFQDVINMDKTLIPEGASCVRFNDERRAQCRVLQFKRGTVKSSSSSSSPLRSVSQRRNCMRLPEADKLTCLRESRGVIDVITRTVK